MSSRMFVSPSGTARRVKKLYVGVNGTARKVKRAWVGVNGYARLCYVDEPTTVYFYGAAGDTIYYTYNGSTKYIYFSSGSTSQSATIDMADASASITFTSSVTSYSRTVTITAGSSQTIYMMPRGTAYWYGYFSGFRGILQNMDYTNNTSSRRLELTNIDTRTGATARGTMYTLDSSRISSSSYIHYDLDAGSIYSVEMEGGSYIFIVIIIYIIKHITS